MFSAVNTEEKYSLNLCAVLISESSRVPLSLSIASICKSVFFSLPHYSIVGPDNNDNLYQLLHEVSKEHFLLMGDFNFPAAL